MKPKQFADKIKENMNSNGTLKSLFANQLLPKFEEHELNGLIKSIEKELNNRQENKINELKAELEKYGFNVTKK